jgi:hypothetical protein
VNRELDSILAELRGILSDELPAFNAALAEAGAPAVIVPSSGG